MTTAGGGWTVINRRQAPGLANFRRPWVDYRNGFGNLNTEFWMGNQLLHTISGDGQNFTVRVQLNPCHGQSVWEEYAGFGVESEANKFRLVVPSLAEFFTGI